MRENKFRVWDKKNKKYLTPEPINLFGEFMIIQGLPLERLNDLIVEYYTGLQDKNGKEIFEGDIVEYLQMTVYSFKKAAVGFNKGTFVLIDKRSNVIRQWEYGVHSWSSLENIWSGDIEIIGDIHENPELLL